MESLWHDVKNDLPNKGDLIIVVWCSESTKDTTLLVWRYLDGFPDSVTHWMYAPDFPNYENV